MHVIDAGTGKSANVRSSITSFSYERVYKLEFTCENGKVTAKVDGEMASLPTAMLRALAISSVTLPAGKCPPVPVLAACPPLK
ncbi:hypothetical protein D3C84_1205790 [compost metagenome]